MPAVVPFIPLIAAAGSAVIANGQQKAANKNIDNKNAAAQQQDASAAQQAYAQNQSAIQAALARAQQFNASNPNPVQGYGMIAPPPQYGAGATLGGGTAGPTGVTGAQAAPPPASAALPAPSSSQASGSGLDIGALVQALMRGSASAAPQPPARPAPISPAPQGFGGMRRMF